MLTEPLDFVFWGAPLRHRPFEEHVRAAAAGASPAWPSRPRPTAEARARGLRPADLTALAADHGVPCATSIPCRAGRPRSSCPPTTTCAPAPSSPSTRAWPSAPSWA
ncbi:MAG: hypothetical protein WKG07_02250 [Hymenobacter sp.]